MKTIMEFAGIAILCFFCSGNVIAAIRFILQGNDLFAMLAGTVALLIPAVVIGVWIRKPT